MLYILHPTSYILHPTSYILHPRPEDMLYILLNELPAELLVSQVGERTLTHTLTHTLTLTRARARARAVTGVAGGRAESARWARGDAGGPPARAQACDRACHRM